MRVLVVDDDADLRFCLERYLRTHEVVVECAGSADEARRVLGCHPAGTFDVILLDLQMPGRSGLELLQELRTAGDRTPAIFVSGQKTVDAKVRGLDSGADDYVVKPVELDELLARVRAVRRRRQEPPEPLVHGDVELDLATRTVRRAGRSVDLSPREFDLLHALLRARGEVVDRATLLRDVWKLDFDPKTNLIDVHIGRLRRKIDLHGRPLIQNERGKGYRAVAHAARV